MPLLLRGSSKSLAGSWHSACRVWCQRSHGQGRWPWGSAGPPHHLSQAGPSDRYPIVCISQDHRLGIGRRRKVQIRRIPVYQEPPAQAGPDPWCHQEVLELRLLGPSWHPEL